MTIVMMVAVGLGGLAGIWLAQTVTLWAVGDPRPLAWPFRHSNRSSTVRRVRKLALQATLAGLLVAVPLAAGEDPFAYHLARLGPARWGAFVTAMAGTLVILGSMLAIECAGRWVRLTTRHGLGASLLKVIGASLMPLPLAFIEEAVFRGVVLEELLRALPETPLGMGLPVVLSAVVFASAHFIRPLRPVASLWLGLFALGVGLGAAYVAGGHTLWLPVAMHAAGVWYIQVSRQFVQYQRPPWLMGYRSYPICGVIGLCRTALVTTWVVTLPAAL